MAAAKMGPSTSLFSRARPGKSTPKALRGFLSLPRELRNEVYQYCFEFQLRCEIAAKGNQFKQRRVRTVKLWAGAFQPDAQIFKYESKAKEEDPMTIRVSRPLGRYNVVKGLQTNWFTSFFAISLVCKQVHLETLLYLYHKTLFVFDASNRLFNFLQVIPSSKLQHITKLQLHYTTYGSPRMLEDRIWQDKHTISWICACNDASKKLVGLRELKIWVRVRDNPPRFDLREPWVLPLLKFRRLGLRSNRSVERSTRDNLKQTKLGLETVGIDLRTFWSGWTFSGNRELANASEKLHGLFSDAISSAILGADEEVAMMAFNTAWNGEHARWQFHLGFAQTGW